ncbi:bifunctional aminoglycoside phosphotransferase/ATP-binding protein [Desulfatiferula olefinivorans]
MKNATTYRPSDLYDQMESPAFYPHPADTVTSLETHISHVVLAGDFVYKIKKPVNFGFVDYDSLDKRRFFCEREVTLNRRLTDGVYRGVVPITCQHGRFCLDGPGPPVEYAVVMRRLPESCSLKNLGRPPSDAVLRDLAALIAAFHEHNPAAEPPPRAETFKRLCGHCLENFGPGAGSLVSRECFDRVRMRTERILARDRPLFLRRMTAGRFRDGHGDLRCGHVYLTDRGIQVLDCIEFNDTLRYLDVASDTAFLVMDLEFLDQPWAAGRFLTHYAAWEKDAGLYRFIDFYKAYRAMVRFKVDRIRMETGHLAAPEKTATASRIRRYLALAERFSETADRPRLWMVCGLPASGKSTLASGLSGAMTARVIRSDAVRKQLFSSSGREPDDQPFETGIYEKTATETTYDRMMTLAATALRRGRSVVLDATFRLRRHRDAAARLAAAEGADRIAVECRATRADRTARLYGREGRRDLLTDARIIHQEPMEAQFEPLAEVDAGSRLIVDTHAPPEVCLRRLLADAYTRSQRALIDIP